MVETPTDSFLGGRVQVVQPASGFRSGLDAVMLAAAVPAVSGQSGLELGAGTGAASLCLAARVPGISVTAVEVQEELVRLGRNNATANGADIAFVAGDVFALAPSLRRGFDQVYANPPFHLEGRNSPTPSRAKALTDRGMLGDWLKLGLKRTAAGGYFTAIIRADRLNEALAALPSRGVCVFPLWARQGEAPKRVIIQARKASAAPFALLAGLILHQPGGAWTAEADAILRHGEALALCGARL